MMGSKAFESPLISHARMRAMYRALVESRLLGKKAGFTLPRGLEACWVGTAIDLHDGDLTSDARGGAMIEFIRSIGTREGSGAPIAGELRRTLRQLKPDPFAGSSADRLLCAVGAAMAVKAAATKGVVLAYVTAGELKSADWRRVLQVSAKGDLPLILVQVPATSARPIDLEKLVSSIEGSTPPIKGFPAPTAIPIIPVDAEDVVALYRVAQESIGRARAEGGTMVIDCVPGKADPIKRLAHQLVSKKICTEAWIARVDTQLRKTITP